MSENKEDYTMDEIVDTMDCRDKEREAEDAPDTQQTFMALCSVTLNELTRAIAKYPEFYHSSNEAAGTVTVYVQAVLDILRKMRVVGSKTFSEDFDQLTIDLLTACVKLNVVVAKTIMSFCDTRPLAERFSNQMKQVQNIAESLQAEDQAAYTPLHYK